MDVRRHRIMEVWMSGGIESWRYGGTEARRRVRPRVGMEGWRRGEFEGTEVWMSGGIEV